jgi:hypothetical protein
MSQLRNINGLFYLKRGSFVIIRNEAKRTYIGEVLDLYKMAAGSRYGSVKTAKGIEELRYLSVKVYLPLITVRQSNFVILLIKTYAINSGTVTTNRR